MKNRYIILIVCVCAITYALFKPYGSAGNTEAQALSIFCRKPNLPAFIINLCQAKLTLFSTPAENPA
jgi:hypothetical protein